MNILRTKVKTERDFSRVIQTTIIKYNLKEKSLITEINYEERS